MNAAGPILDVNGLSVRYGKVEALHGAAIKVRPGQIVSVIGPNGAGKSTLLNAIMGALPTTGHAKGEVLYQGEDVSAVPVEKRVARGMCLVPEKRELFASMTVEDNLVLGAYRRKRAGERNFLDQIEPVFTLFPRLKERRKQAAGTLSGGERQMLAVGRALMGKPDLLMLDEPSLGLAPLIVKEIFHIISALRQTGVATLLIEQNARAALQISDYGYVIETGELALEGPAFDLAQNPRVIAWGEIGLDYHYDHSPRDVQANVFRHQLSQARTAKLPIIIHCREAWPDCLSILEEDWRSSGLGGIFHCFTGTLEESLRGVGMGFFVSFAGNLTYPKAQNLRDVAREIPLEHLLVETDSPFLAPQSHRGRRNEPAFVAEVAQTLGNVRNLPASEVAERTSANFRRFFGLDQTGRRTGQSLEGCHLTSDSEGNL